MFVSTATLQEDFSSQSEPLGKDAKNVAARKKREKFRNYKLLGHAQKKLIESEAKNRKGNPHRTRFCHCVRSYNAEYIGLNISTNPSQGNASLSGVQTCGSVWACPVCARRLAMKRGQEVGQGIDHMIQTGHVPIMITNTARHKLETKLRPFKDAFKKAHRFFVQHYAWKRLKEMLGIQHSIKAVEVTWGAINGWHYHQHAILFVHADALKLLEPEALDTWIQCARDLWMKALAKYGLSGEPERAFHVQASGDVKREYLAKLGLEDETSNLDYELTAGHNKDRGGLKIWGILERSWQGSEQHGELYQEYVEAMTGDQWITWTDHLKEICGIQDISDEDAAAAADDEASETVELMQIDDEEFLPVRKLHAIGDFLAFAAVVRNEQAVRQYLRDLATTWNNSGASKERERMQAQLKAMRERWENWRRQINKTQQFPAPGGEFDKLYQQIKELEGKLNQ